MSCTDFSNIGVMDLEKNVLAHKKDFFNFIETIKDDRFEDITLTTPEGELFIISGPEKMKTQLSELITS